MILKALALGFSTGFFCLGQCFPLLAPLLLSQEEASVRRNTRMLGHFVFGRLVAYLVFGALIGYAGRYTQDMPVLQHIVLPSLFLGLGITMVLYGFFQSFPQFKVCWVSSSLFQRPLHMFVVGFLAGINLCPPFLLATGYFLTTGGILRGMVFFFFFFLATTVFLVPFLFSSFVSQYKDVRFAARITAVMVGVWFVYLAVHSLLLA